MNKISLEKKYFLLGIAFLLIALWWLSGFSFLSLVTLMGTYILLMLLFINIAWGVLFLLIVRSSVDIVGKWSVIKIENILSLNLASLLALIIIFLFGFLYLKYQFKLPFKKPWIFFLGINFLSLFYSVDKFTSLEEVIRIMGIISSFYLVYFLYKSKKISFNFAKIIILALVAPSLVGFFQLITQKGLFVEYITRVYGTFGHPNVLAMGLLLAISAVLILFYKSKNKYWLLLSLVFLILLLATYMRAGLIGLVFYILLYGILFFPKFSFRLIGSVFILILLGFLLIKPYFPKIISSAKNIAWIQRFLELKQENSFDWRVRNWKQMWPEFKKRPLSGWGTATYPILRERKLWRTEGGLEAHNDYFRFLVETGIVGFVSFLYLIFSLFKELIKKYRKVNPNFKKEILNFILISLVFYLISFSDNVFSATAVQWLFWGYVGYLISKK